MAGFAKTILVSILVVVVFLIFTNLVYFFPWYMTLAYETYNLATMAANYNYLSEGDELLVLDKLKNTSVFKENPDSVKIESDRKGEINKGQRGELFYVAIKADFPFEVEMSGVEIKKSFTFEYRLPVTGIKFYKDLEY